jgi:hypothetical protein
MKWRRLIAAIGISALLEWLRRHWDDWRPKPAPPEPGDGAGDSHERGENEHPADEFDLKDDPSVLSPPIVAEPLYACGESVTVLGFVPGATIEVELDGAVVASGISVHPDPGGEAFGLATALIAGSIVRARQSTAAGTSDWSAPAAVRDHSVDYPAGPPRPQIDPAPVYECGSRTGVTNLLRGCSVWITADAAERGRVDDAQQGEGAVVHQGVSVSPDYGLGELVVAWAEICQDPSPPSATHTTVPPPAPLPAPAFEPGYEGGTRIVVTNVVNGARFTIERGGVVQGTWSGWGGRSYIDLSPAFGAGESLSITQRMCPGDPDSPPGTTVIRPCSALPAPTAEPVENGDTSIVLTSWAAGAVIKVYKNLVKIGEGGPPTVALTEAVHHGDTVHIRQSVGACEGSTIREAGVHCVAPHVVGNPAGLDLFPVGYTDYQDPTPVNFLGEDLVVKGTVYYPADADGSATPFNSRLASLGRVPVVFIAHGNHGIWHDPDDRTIESCAMSPGWVEIPNHTGYDYFQRQLAQMGIVAVGVYSNHANCRDFSVNTIVRRAQVVIGSIRHFRDADAGGDPIFGGRLDLDRVGLMGHSQGGEAVLVVPEVMTLPGVSVRGVLSLAPVDFGATSGRPSGFAFQTILPAGDGDVSDNDGARFYDMAAPSPFKSEPFVHFTNHNWFNRHWPGDDHDGPPVMPRIDHERVLSTYGCAFFRAALLGHGTTDVLAHRVRPAGVMADNVHLSFEWEAQTDVDHHEDGNGVAVNSMNAPTSQSGGVVADEYPFRQGGGAFNGTFYGNTVGLVAEAKEPGGEFRSQLDKPRDLRGLEVWIRAGEVHNESNVPAGATGFELGLEDTEGLVGWVDSDDVGGVPRPYDRPGPKTMPNTLRFACDCFRDAEPNLNLAKIQAIRLRLDRPDGRALAFDVLQIVDR